MYLYYHTKNTIRNIQKAAAIIVRKKYRVVSFQFLSSQTMRILFIQRLLIQLHHKGKHDHVQYHPHALVVCGGCFCDKMIIE